MTASLDNAASIKPPVIGVDTIIIASSTSSARVQIPTSWLGSWITVKADGCDCYFGFSASATATVDGTAVTTITSGAVASHGTGECDKVVDGGKESYDLSKLEKLSSTQHWHFVHKESAGSAYVRLIRSSGPASRA